MGNKQEMNASKQTLKDKLMAIILLETSKDYKEMDSGLVAECVDFLMELEGKERLSKAEIKQRVSEIPFKGRVTAFGSDMKKKVRAKRLALVAAVIALILALFSIFTLASDSTFGDLLSKMGHSLMELMDERTVEFNGVTMYNNDDVKKYETIEELISAEKIDILYPTWLPENVKISQVMYISESDSERYCVLCEEPTCSVDIYLNKIIDKEIIIDCLTKEINEYKVYYFVEENFAQGSFAYENNVYTINADTEENLFKIVENLKEIN